MKELWYLFNSSYKSTSAYSVQMRENTDQKNSKYGHFSRSVFILYFNLLRQCFKQAW